MITKNRFCKIALGSLMAAGTLIAGQPRASAQGAPGGGSFPQSFLVPGTNTSIAIYGTIRLKISTNLGSPHLSDTGPAGAGATGWAIGGIPLDGPGASTTDLEERSLNGGLRWSAKYSNIIFETRTPSDLGEIKTVVQFSFNKLTNQGTYQSSSSTATNEPQVGAGNNELPRMEWAYGTLGPWLIGQYNSAFQDPLLINPVGDVASQVGPLQTANIRRPQIRYTYLVGNGVALSASLEANTYANKRDLSVGNHVAVPINEDSTNIGGITNYPSFNAGIAWTQPWGHLMGRVGFAEDEIRNNQGIVAGTSSTNMKKFGWAVSGGVMLNTWGQDQWRGMIVYSAGAPTYLTDMGQAAYVNSTTGAMELIKEFAVNTSYVHRFSPNWRASADFGIGFFNKPSNTVGFSTTQLAHFEKRHLNSALDLTYSPVPGKVDISLEWDHYERWVQAVNTSGRGNVYSATFAFYW